MALTAALAGTPALVEALPADDVELDAAALLQRVQGSDGVAWSGYGEARGDLVLPDVEQLGELPQFISGTTRLRAWWRGPADFRVDALSLVGETDVSVKDGRTWTWESADRAATLVRGELDVRLPRGADLLAPALGARLSRSDGVQVERLRARRVAGVDAAGLRLLPADPGRTTVERVDLWADPATGLALRVELHAVGVKGAALTSLLLDLDRAQPAAERTRFLPPFGSDIAVVEAPDLAALADRYAPFRLPATVAGLPRRQRVDDVGEGVGTYGDGFTALTVVPLEGRTAGGLIDELRQDGDPGSQASFSTALLQGLVARVDERAYLLVGSVPQQVLRAGLAQLAADPPPRRPR